MWAIASSKPIMPGTNAATELGAWREFYGIEQAASKKDMAEFIKRAKLEGYSAVRLRYEIVERDGEESNGR
jgi:hypothetical protein